MGDAGFLRSGKNKDPDLFDLLHGLKKSLSFP